MIRPDLLLCPVIPPPLHGLSPRKILGQTWWDSVRQSVYGVNDHCCWACGVHKSEAFYKKYLEAHEVYDIDYTTHMMMLEEIVGLCHSCHNYIHVGFLLSKYRNDVVSKSYVTNVLNHGIRILSAAGLKPQATQAYHWLTMYKNYDELAALKYIKDAKLQGDKFRFESWDEWKIIIEGTEYKGKTVPEWENMYA